MSNLLFIKIEIIIMLFSFSYIIYYLFDKIYSFYSGIKKIVKIEKKEKNTIQKINITKKKEEKPNYNKKVIGQDDKEKLISILKRVKLNIAKGYTDLATNLIVEGLAIDKNHRDLNFELAQLYEKEKQYLNAEYIYKDLLNIYKSDFEVMKNLAYIYALQNKLKKSLELYEIIYSKKKSDDNVVNMLAELTFSMKKYKKALKYSNAYLKSKPRDIEKLFIKGFSLEQLEKFKDSLLVYKRILELQPYNKKAKDKINFIGDLLLSNDNKY